MDTLSLPMNTMPSAMGGGLPATAGPAPDELTRSQKAALIVRLLLTEGGSLPLSDLSDEMQRNLAHELAGIRAVQKETLNAVVAEFIEHLESVGASFPAGLENALDVLEDHLSPSAAERLRKEAGMGIKGDPWERIAGVETDLLIPICENEAVEVAAVLLSKLSVPKAAELLEKLEGTLARKISYAVAQTATISPSVVLRIGMSLATQLDAKPVLAFASEPVERVGAILNSTMSSTRESVLEGLDETDKVFAEEVRKAIFTFANIPTRLAPRDVPKAIRGVDQDQLVTAFAGATGPYEEAKNFMLDNMSQRMADGLREEMEAKGKVKTKEAEEAMAVLIAEIRRLEAEGEILLLADEEEED